MAFEKLQSFTKKVADLADRPALNTDELKAVFDAAPNEVREYHNKLIDALQKTTAGDSGAKNIGVATIPGLTGNDIQTILEGLVPTYGSNANGNYVRFPDGLQVCWMRTNATIAKLDAYGTALWQGVYQWNFPISFAFTPMALCSEFMWATGASWGTVYGVTSNNTSLRGIDIANRSGQVATISAFAIGRWK